MILIIPVNSSNLGASVVGSGMIFSTTVVCLEAAFRTNTEVSFNSETNDLTSMNFRVLFQYANIDCRVYHRLQLEYLIDFHLLLMH